MLKNELFSVLTGSRLHGTATEKSDFDYKCLFLPSIDDLLLTNKIGNYKEKPLVEGIEREYIPLQIFLDGFFSGQTYALEIAFAIILGKYEINVNYPHYYNYQTLMSVMVQQFLTRRISKMAGYAVSQARMYGLKTERFEALSAAHSAIEKNRDDTILKNNPALLETLCGLKGVSMSTIEELSGIEALDICGKKFPLTNSWDVVLRALSKILGSYGARVKEYSGKKVDWKAMAHAIRITEQVIELSLERRLSLPHPNAEFLLRVKRGEVPLPEASAYLQTAFLKMEESLVSSILPEATPKLEARFKEWKLAILYRMYNI